ncbi:hypothetical protein E3V39_11285 [Gammaproteobacteria bacterium LSUCC0112]|nr:hypothetical protein E3V39_11285 [Gammaproteobacteria bacterium LSUCC0112]
MLNTAEQLDTLGRQTLQTRLMPDVLEQLAKHSPLMVFDVGFGVHETVEFFGNRKCRLHFSALHEGLRVPPVVKSKTPFGQLTDQSEKDNALYLAWLERFQSAMQFAPGTRFDLCLFWDFLNYLDDQALKAFADVLAPYTSPQTLAHAYILLKPEADVLNREYGVKAADLISVKPAQYGSLAFYARPQARVTSMMKGFAVKHSVLRRDGLLEAALKSA